jgi:serine protease Do
MVFILAGLVTVLTGQEQLSFDRKTPVVKVYEKTHKAVVSITGERVETSSIWPNADWPGIFGFGGPKYQRQVKVLGSGVVVHENGYIITNTHVVESAQKITVIFSDGRELPAKTISIDQTKDLAVLSVKAEDKLPFIQLGRSSDLMIGETVIAIGNPYGYANTVTSGVISAVGRDIEVTEGHWLRGLVQTDAPINPGNSGGPLLNINGEIIGINTVIRAEAQNIGFAIPVDTLADSLIYMLMPENLRRMQLGLVMGRMRTIGTITGLVIDSVTKGSPADQKGLAGGDVVLEVDGEKLTSIVDFYIKIKDKELGQPIQIKYARPVTAEPEIRTVKLTLVTQPLPDGRKLVRDFFQMEVSELTDSIAKRFDFESAYPILIITDVNADGIAAQANIKPGDLILQINNAAVRDIKELSLLMEKISEGDTVELKILRIRIGAYGQIQRQFLIQLRAQRQKPRRFSF